MKYLMRERIFGFGEDHWIRDEHDDKVFLVDGKSLRIRETFELKDAETRETLLEVKKRLLSFRDRMNIERDGDTIATVHKKLLHLFRDKYLVEFEDGVTPDIEITGNFLDHEYQLEQEGRRIAQVSKKWFSFRDTYAIDVEEGVDVPLVLAVAVCVDHLEAEDKPGEQ
ncbi:LURP-one-related/scramblase family protein [Streptacidiphilus monticola]|uniref:LURP-one-related/scramblase family protein n=1 Tax=Streptacidiphilus monticola TaxID=2161674 RepID=A0ABW1G5T2_9ACTN